LTIIAGAVHAQLAPYENDNFSGRVYRTGTTAQNLDDAGFNDRASSVVVRNGRWQVCSDANVRAVGMNDRISSARDQGSTPSGGTAAQLPGTVPLQGRERGYCRLTNVACRRDQYSGVCTIKQEVNGQSIVYDIKMGSAPSFKFATSDGGRTWMSGPQQVRFRDQGHTGVFRWSNFRLEVAED
jgi:hypothetical protein